MVCRIGIRSSRNVLILFNRFYYSLSCLVSSDRINVELYSNFITVVAVVRDDLKYYKMFSSEHCFYKIERKYIIHSHLIMLR